MVHLRRAAHVLVQGGVERVLVGHGGSAVQVGVRVPPQGPLAAEVAVAVDGVGRGASCSGGRPKDQESGTCTCGARLNDDLTKIRHERGTN